MPGQRNKLDRCYTDKQIEFGRRSVAAMKSRTPSNMIDPFCKKKKGPTRQTTRGGGGLQVHGSVVWGEPVQVNYTAFLG